jgi:membrane associated rhomboid family serine protease
MIYGVLPLDPLVSFESHLFGALAGVLYVALPGNRAARLS